MARRLDRDAPTAPRVDAQGLEANPKAALQFLFEQVSQGNLVYDAFMARDFVSHHPARPDITGIPNYRAFMQGHRDAFPDFELMVEDIVVDGLKAVVRWTATGTHERPFFGSPVTGNRVQWTGITFYRIENGRIAEEWVQSDALGLARQLGTVSEVFSSIT